mmetsp:Transcript_45314/g.73862  ORF Transcript_45314/g.73862 Transcript_45314/m.73862 type:complete len:205 (+) Transcript_45314:120-734(+)
MLCMALADPKTYGLFCPLPKNGRATSGAAHYAGLPVLQPLQCGRVQHAAALLVQPPQLLLPPQLPAERQNLLVAVALCEHVAVVVGAVEPEGLPGGGQRPRVLQRPGAVLVEEHARHEVVDLLDEIGERRHLERRPHTQEQVATGQVHDGLAHEFHGDVLPKEHDVRLHEALALVAARGPILHHFGLDLGYGHLLVTADTVRVT